MTRREDRIFARVERLRRRFSWYSSEGKVNAWWALCVGSRMHSFGPVHMLRSEDAYVTLSHGDHHICT